MGYQAKQSTIFEESCLTARFLCVELSPVDLAKDDPFLAIFGYHMFYSVTFTYDFFVFFVRLCDKKSQKSDFRDSSRATSCHVHC